MQACEAGRDLRKAIGVMVDMRMAGVLPGCAPRPAAPPPRRPAAPGADARARACRVEAYNGLLACCRASGQIPKAMEVYRGMQRQGVAADTRTYNLVLDMLTAQQRHAEALEVLQVRCLVPPGAVALFPLLLQSPSCLGATAVRV
jgi:pentatricopeptide repeat protein